MDFPFRRVVAALALVPALLFAATPAAKKPVKTEKPAPIKASATVRKWMRTMTLRDEVAQLVFIPFYGQAPNSRTRAYRNFMRLIRETKVGGLILLNASGPRGTVKAEPYALAAFLNRMQRLARVPLMVGADFERGASMRVDEVTVFPHAMAFGATGDPALSRFEGEVTAKEARALGIQWVYYPDADVNNNPDNPIINIRSFGENPQAVAAYVKAFIEGAHADKKNYILTTAKHFPGHGDTAVDTHLNLATIPADLDRLQHLELVPFKAAIEAGVDSIMTAHIAVPALAPADLPATLSPAILTGLLRDQLGFKGLVITDSLEMGGIAQGFTSADAAVRAIEAGADTLLMPADPEAAIRAVVAAVGSGRLTRTRIQESVAKILAAKERVGLDRKRFVDLEGIGDVVNSPEDNDRAQEIADRAVTLVRNQGNAVPLADPQGTLFCGDAGEPLFGGRPDIHAGSAQARARRGYRNARSLHAAGSRRRRAREIAKLFRLRCRGIFRRELRPRIGGARGRFAAGRTSPDGVGQARDHGRARQPLPVAEFPDRNGISRHFQHGSAFRDRRGEGAVG